MVNTLLIGKSSLFEYFQMNENKVHFIRSKDYFLLCDT